MGSDKPPAFYVEAIEDKSLLVFWSGGLWFAVLRPVLRTFIRRIVGKITV